MNRHLHCPKVPQQIPNFRLIKMRPRTHLYSQQFFDHMRVKSLEARSHILEFAAKKHAREDRSGLGKKAALQRRSQVRSAIYVSAPKRAFIAFAQHPQEHRYRIWVM